ncbi:nucleotide modification associated domain-containing protein [Paenibacillus xylaniclasticus]|uniref:nucleotide modification associated domain-containing protein n=1 Tax=Paenibacillus xylaniclasticus TaxID=588083 RepID=UPI000FD81ADA|nr:hypothetical protein PCURB6_27560 [Paenibacillus curdlanolyticus]
MKSTLICKNSDYGDAFAKRYSKHGILSAFIRMEDKWLRLENLIGGASQQVANESVYDTIKDLAGYCILTLIELDKERGINTV